jgi:hypothetical protein
MLPNEIFSYRYQKSKWWTHLLPVPELFNRLNPFHQTWHSCIELKAGGPRLSISFQKLRFHQNPETSFTNLLQKNLCEIYGQLILFFTIFDLKTSGLLKMTEYALSAN